MIEYLTVLQIQGKGDYKVVSGEHGYEITSDNPEINAEKKELTIW